MKPDTVVFACVHNAGRSQMAAAFCRTHADPQRLHVLSAGTNPGTTVHPEVKTVMAELGIDLSQAEPTRLTPELAQDAAFLITMGCGEACPVLPGVRVEDWPLEDPKGNTLERVRAIRDEIKERVLEWLTRQKALRQ